MADDHAPAKWLSAGVQISQILAILVAGVWVFYTFVLKENSKTHHITPSIEVRALGPPEHGSADSKFRAFELTISVHNVSERDLYIIAGIVYAFGHKAEPEREDDFYQKGVDTKKMGPQMMMRGVNWRGRGRDDLGVTVTFPKFALARAEKATQQYVLLTPSSEYDILEIWAEFHVVDACKYVFPIERCYEFFASFGWTAPKRPYLEFRYHNNGKNGGEPISVDELQKRFRYKNFQTTHMLVLPGAPILKISK